MKKLRLAVLLSVLCAEALAQSSNSIEAAKRAIAAGNPLQAIELLQPLEAEQAGNVPFDYVLGLARLDSGDPERAIFAFERVLAMQPNHMQARAEIGRAFLMLGEKEAGIRELKAVNDGDVPPEVKATIETYLSAFGAGPTRFSGFIETTAGYDSNINSATASRQLAVPGLGTFTLQENGRRQSSNYLSFGGGINIFHPINENWSVIGGATFNQRLNIRVERFDTTNLEGNVGLRYAIGAHAFTVGLQKQTFEVEDIRNRDATGLVGQWQHQLDSKTQISLFGQYIQLRYPGQGQNLRDANRSVGGFALAKVFDGSLTPSLFASVYFGEERETHSNVEYHGHKPVGIRFGGQIKPSSSTTFFANTSYEHRRYGGRDPVFQVGRNDQQWDIRTGINFEPIRNLVISPQVSYTRNDSNVAINDYSRNMVSVTVRRDF